MRWEAPTPRRWQVSRVIPAANPKRSWRIVFADSQAHRQWLWQKGINPFLAKRGTPHGSGLGIHRWVVERAFAWLKGFRRLRLRDERTAAMHEAALSLAMCLVCCRHL